MTRIEAEAMERELVATDENYVKHKLISGQYCATEIRYVEGWLAKQATQRAELRAAEDLAISRKTATWTKVQALCALATAGAGAITYLIAKAG